MLRRKKQLQKGKFYDIFLVYDNENMYDKQTKSQEQIY